MAFTNEPSSSGFDFRSGEYSESKSHSQMGMLVGTVVISCGVGMEYGHSRTVKARMLGLEDHFRTLYSLFSLSKDQLSWETRGWPVYLKDAPMADAVRMRRSGDGVALDRGLLPRNIISVISRGSRTKILSMRLSMYKRRHVYHLKVGWSMVDSGY
jgi:hypothetical protein